VHRQAEPAGTESPSAVTTHSRGAVADRGARADGEPCGEVLDGVDRDTVDGDGAEPQPATVKAASAAPTRTVRACVRTFLGSEPSLSPIVGGGSGRSHEILMRTMRYTSRSASRSRGSSIARPFAPSSSVRCVGGDIRIGTSGWLYPPWRGVFYPPKLPHRRELEYLSSQLNSVEINGTFYSLQRPASFATWYAQTPDDFTFAVKGARFITHMKKLADAATPLANFFASGVLALRDKLGPVLWQLPPTLGFDADRLATFFAQLPRSTGEAAWLAKRHDDRMTDRAYLVAPPDERPLRHALEIRHKSFETPAFAELLREHAVALVIADTAGRWPLLRDVTADLVYVRLHGDVELYTSGYTDEALDKWASDIRGWSGRGLDVQVHFDNDVKVHAPYNAICLAEKLGVGRATTAAFAAR
jgi:uncharacterized protein YecE (DUF72 family)